MLLRSQLCHLSSGLHTNGSSTQQVQCTATGRPQGTQRHTTSSVAAASHAVQVSHSQQGRWAAGAISSSSTSSVCRSAGVICRDAPRPMWAAKTPKDDAPKAAGGDLARMITKDLTKCDSLVDLSDVYNEWGGNFNFIHASAAVIKYAKLKKSRGEDTQLLPRLLRCWLQQLPDAGEQACANVLWALSKLGTGLDEVWEPTFETFLRLLQQDAPVESINSQNISNTLLACARLRKQPTPDQLQVLMQAVMLPKVLAAAEPQHLANIVWALGKLCKLKGWHGGVAEDAIQQLLAQQQLQLLVSSGKAQEISNVLLGLADMAMAESPVVSIAFAEHCSRQLLDDSCQRLAAGNAQGVCNSLYACGELGLAHEQLLTAAAAAATEWLPTSQVQNVVQAATACVKLQFRHQGLMVALLMHGQQLLQPSAAQGRQQRHSRSLPLKDKDILTGVLCSAVAHLDMQQLASEAVQLVTTSGIRQRPDTHEADLNRLWVFHSWLLQHQLAGGQGLKGLLTQQQLQRGQQAAVRYPDFV